MIKCARDPQPCQTQHNYHHDEPPARAWEAIVKAIGAVSFVSLGRPHLASVAVIGHSGQERRCSRARQNRLPIISAGRRLMPCVYVSKLVNRRPMVAGFPREAIEFGRGSGKMSVGWRLLLLAVLSRYRGWLPAPKGTVILAPLTLLWRGVVLPSLETVVAAAITVGIALTSKPSKLIQTIAFSPAHSILPLPRGRLVLQLF